MIESELAGEISLKGSARGGFVGVRGRDVEVISMQDDSREGYKYHSSRVL